MTKIAAIGKAAEAGVLDSDDAGRLVAGAELHHRLQAVLRLSLDDRLKPETAPEGLRAALVRAAEPDADAALPRMDFATLCTMLIEAQAAVRAIFDRLTAASDDQSEGVAAS